MGMRDEILEQPAVAAGLLETGLPLIEAIARAIRSREIEYVTIAAGERPITLASTPSTSS